MIQWSEEVPDSQTDNKIPVLDLKIWIDPSDNKNRVKHEFYKKSVANVEIIDKKSAIPTKIKVNILIEEGWRRLRNCCLSLSPDKIDSVIIEFNRQMMIDGHSENFRIQITETVLKKYRQRLMMDLNGQRPFYRDRQTRLAESKVTKKVD